MKFLLISFFVLLCLENYAQEPVWIEVEGSCVVANITPEEARQKAITNARNEAIKQAVGVQVSEDITRTVTEDMVNNESTIYDNFSKLSRSTSFGKIIREEPLIKDEIALLDGTPVYNIKLKALVVKEEGNPDYGFEVKIKMDKDVFFSSAARQSDEIKFNIWASKDCYIYLFNLMSNDSVQLIIPNQYISNNNKYINGAEKQEFERELENNNISFIASLPPGKDRVTEALYVVALKEKIDFFPADEDASATGIMSTSQTAMTDIQNWLMKIPRNLRTEQLKAFQIKRIN